MVEVKGNPKTQANEVYVNGLMVGFFEQLDREKSSYSFMVKCSHEKLTGDHYIAIGTALNSFNSNSAIETDPKVLVSKAS